MGDVAPLTAAQHRALDRLRSVNLLDDVYLAGGVGIAWHLGHRRSMDLDLFSRTPKMDLDAIRMVAVRELSATVVYQTDVALSLRLQRAAIDVVRYPYRRVAPLVEGPDGSQVASLRDLAVMKAAAIARRGIRRDFWDLHAILTTTRLTLAGVLRDYLRKCASMQSPRPTPTTCCGR